MTISLPPNVLTACTSDSTCMLTLLELVLLLLLLVTITISIIIISPLNNIHPIHQTASIFVEYNKYFYTYHTHTYIPLNAVNGHISGR